MRRAIVAQCAVDECFESRESRRGRFCQRHRYLFERYGSTDDPRAPRRCEGPECGVEFEPSRRGVKYCMEACRRRAQRAGYAPRSAVLFPVCEVCGAVFSSRKSGGAMPRYCPRLECKDEGKRRANRAGERRHREVHGESRVRAAERAAPAASKAAKRERDRRRNAELSNRKRYPDQFAAKDARRRMRKLGNASEVVVFTRLEVYERDGWMCQLCQEPVDGALEYPDRDSPSLDHIIPLALDGPHTFDNCQLAHLRCNIEKGARLAL